MFRARAFFVSILVLAFARVAAEEPAPAAPAARSEEAAAALETSIASSRRRMIRETPGVVTVLTRDEILASGARDLSELLVQVPGFQLGVDVSNGIGAGFRGIWGQEGKILYLVDGVEMNELSYGTFLLGQRLPVDQLERVEIIRGPGSALYGGHAELAVVDVRTRAWGATGTVSSSFLLRGASGAATTFAAVAPIGDAKLGLSASLASGTTSNRTYTDFAGSSTDLARSSRITPSNVTARFAWRNLDVRALYDDYAVTSRDGYDLVLPTDFQMRFRAAALDARAPFEVGAVTLTPQLTYRWEQPWHSSAVDLPDLYYYEVTNQRLTGRLVAAWDTLRGPSVVGGVQAWVENSRLDSPDSPRVDPTAKRSIAQSGVAAFAELGLDTAWANLLAGGRVEHHSAYGTAAVPRLAITRSIGPFHAKLLASGAYRAPSFENVNLAAGDIKPERTWVFEAEGGWTLSDALSATVNAFDVTVLDPIVYGFDGSESYSNAARTGSRGAEATLQTVVGRVTASASYSFYTAAGKNHVPAYAVDGSRALLVGFSGHKVVASARVRLLPGLTVTPAVTFLSSRSTYDGTEATGAPAAGRIGDRTQLDLFASWRDLGAKGLEFTVGVRDLLDQGTVYVQPYPGYHAPLPGQGREGWLRVSAAL